MVQSPALPAGYAAWLADLKTRIRETRLRAVLDRPSFAEAWPDPGFLQRVVGKLPWGQNIELLAVKDLAARLWYAEAALEHGWSRPVLPARIETQAPAHQGQALMNFARVLPPETSDLAQQVLKDSYQFDFLTLRHAAHERDVERALIARDKELPLELSKGFSFIGGGDDA